MKNYLLILAFADYICSRKTSNSKPIQRCWTEYYIWFKSPGFLQWCTSEACLLLRAIQILGLLMLETGFHLADLKPETVSSHLALGWDCRHLCEIQCRGGLMYTYFLCFLPILGKEYRDKRNLKDSLPTLLIFHLLLRLMFLQRVMGSKTHFTSLLCSSPLLNVSSSYQLFFLFCS